MKNKLRGLIRKYIKRNSLETGWIDISKERPPNNIKILVYGQIIRELREGEIEYGQCVVNSGEDDGTNLYYSSCSDFYIVECLATHWRIIDDPKHTENWYEN